MPVPAEYERVSAQFYAYLVDARDTPGLWSMHVTSTMTQGVFQTFRRRGRFPAAVNRWATTAFGTQTHSTPG
jgi:uncharacterized protein (DUF2267 family)